MNVENLFTIEEVLQRLAQTRAKGCLLLYSIEESFHIFVKDGYIVQAISGNAQGESVLKKAMHMLGASLLWFEGAQPKTEGIHANAMAYAIQRAVIRDEEMLRTSLGPLSLSKPKKKIQSNYCLVGKKDPNLRIQLTRASILGRDVTCDILIDNSQVSRRHCLLDPTEQGLLVRDLDSTNGTFINSVRLVDVAYIKNGDDISLGSFPMTLQND